jgi:HSP20 family molecular chaperone IbpA
MSSNSGLFPSSSVNAAKGGNAMVWRRYPFESMWHGMAEMRAELDHRVNQPGAGCRLLLPGGICDPVIPSIRGEFRVDVREHGDGVIVAADLPGADNDTVSLNLINPRALAISSERNKQTGERGEGYFCPGKGLWKNAPHRRTSSRCDGKYREKPVLKTGFWKSP